MFTRNWPRHMLCLSLSLPLGSALACGPDFPMRLLDNRGQSLAELPEGNFNVEINRLGHAIAGLKKMSPQPPTFRGTVTAMRRITRGNGTPPNRPV